MNCSKQARRVSPLTWSSYPPAPASASPPESFSRIAYAELLDSECKNACCNFARRHLSRSKKVERLSSALLPTTSHLLQRHAPTC